MSSIFNNHIFNIVLVIFIIIVGSKLYFNSDTFNLRCIISDVNGNKYCVRDRNKLEQAGVLAKKLLSTEFSVETMAKQYSKIYDQLMIRG